MTRHPTKFWICGQYCGILELLEVWWRSFLLWLALSGALVITCTQGMESMSSMSMLTKATSRKAEDASLRHRPLRMTSSHPRPTLTCLGRSQITRKNQIIKSTFSSFQYIGESLVLPVKVSRKWKVWSEINLAELIFKYHVRLKKFKEI